MPNNLPPWEMSWGRGEIEYEDPPIPPWEKEWGRKPNINVEGFSPIMQEGSLSFDDVFNKLIQAESNWRHRDEEGNLITSPVGARGIAQIMPKTAKDPGYGVKPLQDDSEEESLRFGRDYLSALVKDFNGDYRKAVAAYNAGPGNVKKAVRLSKKSGKDWTEHLPKKEETLPYMETILGDNPKNLDKRGDDPEKKDLVSGFDLQDAVELANSHFAMTDINRFLEASGKIPDLGVSSSLPGMGRYRIRANQVLVRSDYRSSPIEEVANTLIHEYTHAADTIMDEYGRDLFIQLQFSGESGLTPEEVQFAKAYGKLARRRLRGEEEGRRTDSRYQQTARSFDPEWEKAGRRYRTTAPELVAWGVAESSFPGEEDRAPLHVNPTIATDFLITLQLATKAIESRKKLTKEKSK